MPNWEYVRKEFPVFKEYVYLNTASRGAISIKAIRQVQKYYELSALGDITLDDWLTRVEVIREQLAKFINASCDEIAFISNSLLGMNFAAQLFIGEGEVITMSDEFPSVTLPWLQHKYSTKFVKSQPDGKIKLENIENCINQNTKFVVTSYVQYATGFKHDLLELGKFCQDRSLILIVDATQAFGVYPIDVQGQQIDILLFSGYKWATAGYGIAALFIKKEILDSRSLPAVGWRSAKVPNKMLSEKLDLSTNATALELGHPPFAGIFALGAAIDLLKEIGNENIEFIVFELTNYLHKKLQENNIGIISTTDIRFRSGITVVDVSNPKVIADELKKRKIVVSARGQGLRISLHFYNNYEDIERFVSEIIEILKSLKA